MTDVESGSESARRRFRPRVAGLLISAGAILLALVLWPDAPPPQPNTAFTSAILDRYSPGSRFGKPIDWLAHGETLKSLDRQSSGAATKSVAKAGDGVSEVTVWAPRARDGRPTNPLLAAKFAFAVDLPDDRRTPPYAITVVVDSLFGASPTPGCAYRDERGWPGYLVFSWDGGPKGGAALLVETNVPSARRNEPEATLIVFPAGVRASEVVPFGRIRPCTGMREEGLR